MREHELLKKLGLQIRAYRKAADLTLEQMATKLGVSYRTVADIERGLQFTSIANLYQISKIVGCDLPDLFSWAATKKNPDAAGMQQSLSKIADDLGELRKVVTKKKRTPVKR